MSQPKTKQPKIDLSRLEQTVTEVDIMLGNCQLEMPEHTYKRLRASVDKMFMGMHGYQKMTLEEALVAGREELYRLDRKGPIENPTHVGAELWEFEGGSMRAEDFLWAK